MIRDFTTTACLTLILAAGLPPGHDHAAAGRTPPEHTLTKTDIDRWMHDLSNWGRWGRVDHAGSFNLIIPARRKSEARLVEEGFSVSLERTTGSKRHTFTSEAVMWCWFGRGLAQPVHQLLLIAMGTAILDNCDLEALGDAAAERARWDFLLTASSLSAGGGTGSPLNPIATF
jgi:hypothetical protein